MKCENRNTVPTDDQNTNKKALIVSCNDDYDFETRTKYVQEVLEELGYRVTFLVADFSHRKKCQYKVAREGVNYVHVNGYKKNLSLGRLLSNLQFGNGVKKYLLKNDVDLVYHCAPPNNTIKKIAKVKRKKSFTLLTEIGDMWPESIPISGFLKKVLFLPFLTWKRLRDKYLNNSDGIITECDLFKERLQGTLGLVQMQKLYFCKKNSKQTGIVPKRTDELSFCYLGSLNNIVDIDFMAMLLSKCSKKKKTILHIVGGGESKECLITRCRELNLNFVDHGVVFDEDEKERIFSNCKFGFNVMKNSVVVGMTMKSLDYFSHSIPIINNIPGDTWELVNENRIGFNASYDDIDNVVDKIVGLSDRDYLKMVGNVENVFLELFSFQRFKKQFLSLLQEIEGRRR